MDKQIYRKDMAECVLCMDPPCSEACSEMDAGRILRSIWFDNERGAALKLTEACVSCNGECESMHQGCADKEGNVKAFKGSG